MVEALYEGRQAWALFFFDKYLELPKLLRGVSGGFCALVSIRGGRRRLLIQKWILGLVDIDRVCERIIHVDLTHFLHEFHVLLLVIFHFILYAFSCIA